MNDDYDAMHHVGFLKNEKRMNVAITRAKELLIIVGNVRVLQKDYHWKHVVQFAKERNALLGL
jgi:superfamily I DNA and/or RNA helicase